MTNRGGRTCHAAIVSRELGVPAIVGTETGTAALATGQMVTVSCAEGDTGFVYEGARAFDVERVNLSSAQAAAHRIMMNVANPDEAFALSFIPNDGVGLARLEFIINNTIGVHPMALVRYGQLSATGPCRRRSPDRVATPTSRRSSWTSWRKAWPRLPPPSIPRTSSSG